MMIEYSKKPAVFIVGPTGVGKTHFGFQLAKRLGGEIISADSRQMYRYINIGTDKPPQAMREEIPHYFIDILEPDEYYNAGLYGKDVRKKIQEIQSRGKIPFIVGGSGLYIRAIIEGFFTETIKDYAVKKKLQEKAKNEGNESLYKELQKIDSAFAARITLNDTQRIVRGLEVYYTTGIPLTEHWKNKTNDIKFEPLLIGFRMNRKGLYDAINKRVDKMLEQGLIEEVKLLKQKGFSPELNSLQTYGYKETFQYLEGELTIDELKEKIKKRTRNFAKRQITWFKKMKNIIWVDVDNDKENTLETLESIVRQHITGIE